MLRGYKTYVMSALAVIAAAASYFVGDVALMDAMQLAFTGVIGATLRNGMK